MFCTVTAVIAVMPYTPSDAERLEVGLDAGAAARVGAGDRERAGRGAASVAGHRKWSQPVGSSGRSVPVALDRGEALAVDDVGRSP